MSGIGLSILAALFIATLIKLIFEYFKHLKFNSLVHSPGVPYPVILNFYFWIESTNRKITDQI